MSDDLPEEVMAEIFCRLPMKSIGQCSCVCKSWNSLIKTPLFVSTHLHKTLPFTKIHNRPLLFHQLHEGYCQHQYMLRFDNEDLDKYMSLHPPFDKDIPFDVVGSCNGVICLISNEFLWGRYGYRIILWNPFIRKYLLLPLPPSAFLSEWHVRLCDHNFGLGFDSRTCDYKVLRIMNLAGDNGIQFRSELYSLSSNSWKDISDTPNYIFSQSVNTVFVNDALHWIVKVSGNIDDSPIENFAGNLIAVFDCRDEVFHQISLPECLVNVSNSSDLNVKAFGESSIAVVHFDRSDNDKLSHIWVMKEYGAVTSWVNLGLVRKRYGRPSKVLEFRNNGEVLIEALRVGLASQNMTSQTLKIFKGYRGYRGDTSYFNRYVESLALLDKGDDAGNGRYAKGKSMCFWRKLKHDRTCN